MRLAVMNDAKHAGGVKTKTGQLEPCPPYQHEKRPHSLR